MKWQELSNKEKIKSVITDVMRWECFASWENYLNKYGEQEHDLGAGKSYTTPTPTAFYKHQWRVFSADHDASHEELKVFDPLHDWNDAWLVVKEMNKPVSGSHAKYGAFIEQLEKIVGSNMFFDLFYCDPESDDQHLTPERICQAAYKAVQVERKVQ